MKTIISSALIVLGTSAFAQWTTLESGTLNELGAVLVDDADTYWVAGELGTLMKSTDGGATWTTISIAQAGDIEAIERLIDTTLLFAADDSQIGRSTDDGTTWSLIATGAPNVLYDITSFDNHAWASGRDGGLVHSNDAGVTWSVQNSGSNERLHGIHAMDAMNVIAVGRNGTFLRTTNGGETWIGSTLANGEDLADVIFLQDASQTGLIAGPPSEILRSIDLGADWAAIDLNDPREIGSLASENGAVVYAVGADAIILRSQDQGATWEQMTTDAIAELGAVDVKDGVAVAAGANGTILKYDPSLQPQAIGEIKATADLSIYPNPTKGPVTIELKDMQIVNDGFSLELLLMDGRLVDRTVWPIGKKKAFIQQLDPGNYIVRLVSLNGIALQRSLLVVAD